MSFSYQDLKHRALKQLGDEQLLAEAGASLETAKSKFENGVLLLTPNRFLFAGESLDSVFEVGLGDVKIVLKEKKLTFPYLVIATGGDRFSFLFSRDEISSFLKKAVVAVDLFKSDGPAIESDEGNSSGASNLSKAINELNDPAHAEKVSKKSLESMIESLESQPTPVFYSFVEDSMDGQGAGVIQRLTAFVARGWRFEDMSVVASDVGAGMRETHILVSWTGQDG